MKKFLNNLSTLFAIIAVIGILMPTAVFADAVSCDMLNHPDPQNNYVITILEEEIGSNPGTNNNSAPVITCYRVTTTDNDGKKTSTYAEGCNPDQNTICQRVQVIFAQSGASLLYSYIGLIYKWAAGTIGIVSVLYLVYGGILIATAGDNAGQVDKAKEKIFQSISGLILLFLSAVILYTINPNFFTA